MRSTDLDLRGRRSGQVKTTCPLCSHTRKKSSEACLQVNLDTGGWTCWNCEESGHLEDVKTVNGTAFAAKEKKNYKKPQPIEVKERTPARLLEYFAGRGISERTVTKWGVTFGPSFSQPDPENPQRTLRIDGVPQYISGIQFPFREKGELVWVKHLLPREWNNGERRIRAFEGGKPVPFGLDNIGSQAVMFEGEIDAMSGDEAGIEGCFSVPNGAKALGWLEFESVVEKLMQVDKLIICVDNDPDGQALQANFANRVKLLIGAERIYFVQFPDDIKDANEALVKNGPEYLKILVETMSYPMPVEGIAEASEFVDEFMSFYHDGVPRGVSTGIPALDPIYRVLPGSLTTVTGATSSGKSEFLDEMVRNLIMTEGWKFAYYTPENSPHSLHMLKLSEKYIGKPFDTNKFGAMSADEAAAAAQWINENIFYITPHKRTFSVDEILDRAQVLAYRKGIQGLIIDPWNYVRKDFGGLREDQYINQELQKIGVFTKHTGIHIWLVVHPRTQRRNKDGEIEVPNEHDLSGGSKFGDNTDFMFAIERKKKEAAETGIHKIVFHLQKSRNKYVATLGNAELMWIPSNGRFVGLGEPVVMPQEEITTGVVDDSSF